MDYTSSDWRVKAHCNVAYEKNITIINRFNDNYYKLVTFRSLRVDGVELPSDLDKSKKGSVNDVKLLNNISRARNKIFELAMCNDWDFFVTLTLSPSKLNELGLDRYDLQSFYKFFSNWLNHYNLRSNCKIKYLLVPEQHKNGAWHFHGFISGVPKDDLRLFSLDEYLPHYILDKINQGYFLYSWIPFETKFGFNDFEFIVDQERCSSYVTKYISKELYKSINNLGYHCYYCSQGLKRAERVVKDKVVFDKNFEYDFSNEYVSVKVLSATDVENLTFL